MNSPGLRQALSILGRLSVADGGGVGFTRLANECGGLPAPTLSRLLKVLVEEGWARKSAEGAYLPGAEFAAAAGSVAKRTPDIGSVVYPHVVALAETTGESAAFAEWTGGGFAFRAKREIPESFHYISLGQVNKDLSHNGFGRMCLAWQPRKTIEAALNSRGLTDAEFTAALEELGRMRGQEFWIDSDIGERFLAPVLAAGEFAGVLGVSSFPKGRPSGDIEKIAAAVKRGAAAIAAAIAVPGGTGKDTNG